MKDYFRLLQLGHVNRHIIEPIGVESYAYNSSDCTGYKCLACGIKWPIPDQANLYNTVKATLLNSVCKASFWNRIRGVVRQTTRARDLEQILLEQLQRKFHKRKRERRRAQNG